MYDETDTNLRIEALDRAVRVNLATGGTDSDRDTVERATSYLRFLSGKENREDKVWSGVSIVK